MANLYPAYKYALTGWLALMILAGCSSLDVNNAHNKYSEDVTTALTGTSILGHKVAASDLPNLNVLTISPEMAVFAELAVKDANTVYDKAKALHEALLKPVASGGRGITYSAFKTQVPTETFRDRSANCLSYTLLYVALARHLGLNAQVNEVEIPPAWDMRNNNSIVFLRHVNAKVFLGGEIKHSRMLWRVNKIRPDELVVDLEMSRYRPTYIQRTIADDLIVAQYYSNRAMEFANDNDLANAFLYSRKALEYNDQQSYLWNNIASIFYRHNDMDIAKILYLHGLGVNPDDASIMNNLAGVFKALNNSQLAETYQRLARTHRESNPYYQYNLAINAYDNKDVTTALHFVGLALKKEKSEPRFYDFAAKLYSELGDDNKAAQMSKKLELLVLKEGGS